MATEESRGASPRPVASIIATLATHGNYFFRELFLAYTSGCDWLFSLAHASGCDWLFSLAHASGCDLVSSFAHAVPSTAWLPFAHWNLRYNPFGELTQQERVELAVFDPAAVAEPLQRGQTAIQFLGDQGRGKTTRLLSLAHHLSLPPAACLYLPPWSGIQPHWWRRTLRLTGDCLLIDETQRIPWWVRQLVFARRLPLLLGGHRDQTRHLRLCGYRVISYHVGTENDADHVRRVLNRRLQAARLGPGPIPEITAETAERLVTRFGDDLRSMETYLYFRLQEQVGRHEQVRFID